MTIKINLLQSDDEALYEDFLHSVGNSLIYYSIIYRDFLKRVLTNSKDFYMIAHENNRIIGALPTFIIFNAKYGNVLNSLPFYGSHGGIILSQKLSKEEKLNVSHMLIDSIESLIHEKNVVSSTLISSPFQSDDNFYEKHLEYSFQDFRIGQITPLPNEWDNEDKLSDELLKIFHHKTRNCIRKAQKANVIVQHSRSLDIFNLLANHHQLSMEAIGGPHKDWSVFSAVRNMFEYDRHYRLYFAIKDDLPSAFLLVFFYNRTAEYYTPVTLPEYRTYHPMSLLIFEAMKEAARRGCEYWNWGGTSTSLQGVYNFKKRWGTLDKEYKYYVREVHSPSVFRGLTKSEILSQYPNYYVIPFDTIE